ncbi:MAG: adenosylcobinamide-GDP ribazoletransferase [Puia sp.]|nr:adenosylcobinamide-GDP ribazoletransferase [Puia sp.]
MLRKEWKTFLTAVMFLTRIRVPAGIDHHPDYLQRSPRYFPLIGWIIGVICASVFLLFKALFSADFAILGSMIAGILATGAFHEDGFADVCDGFGGGWTREKILLIMKDSRIGAFGAIGLLAMLGSKFLLQKDTLSLTLSPDGIPGHPANSINTAGNCLLCCKNFIVALVAAHSLSRLMPVVIMRFFEYASDPDTSKSKPVATRKPGLGELAFASATALLPFALLPGYFLLSIPPVIIVAFRLAGYFKKWIGGFTGDCLGAIQQVSECVFYLTFIMIGKYIR